MGQRLVITLQKDGKDIAALYYHWSAYSISALQEVKPLLEYLQSEEKKNSDYDPRLACLRFVQANGGGIDGGPKSEEFAYIRNLYPNEPLLEEGYNRSDGLVSMSENGIDDLQSWSNGDVYIDLDKKMVENDVLNFFNSFDDYKEDLKQCMDPEDFNRIPKTEEEAKILEASVNVVNFSFEQIDEVIDVLTQFQEDGYELIDVDFEERGFISTIC